MEWEQNLEHICVFDFEVFKNNENYCLWKSEGNYRPLVLIKTCSCVHTQIPNTTTLFTNSLKVSYKLLGLSVSESTILILVIFHPFNVFHYYLMFGQSQSSCSLFLQFESYIIKIKKCPLETGLDSSLAFENPSFFLLLHCFLILYFLFIWQLCHSNNCCK